MEELIFHFFIITLGYFLGIYISYKNLLKIHGPNSKDIKNIKFKYKNKCYKLKPRIRPCL